MMIITEVEAWSPPVLDVIPPESWEFIVPLFVDLHDNLVLAESELNKEYTYDPVDYPDPLACDKADEAT